MNFFLFSFFFSSFSLLTLKNGVVCMVAPKILIDGDGNLRIRVTLIGTCDELEYEAIADTGFSSDVAVPQDVAITIGLTKAGVSNVMLADGEVVSIPVYLGRCKLGDRIYDASFLVFVDLPQVLIGMGLLSQYEITFDVSSFSAEIRESPNATRPYETSYAMFLRTLMREEE